MNNLHYSKWKNTNTVYTYDGSIEGLFSIVYKSIEQKEVPIKIMPEVKYELNLLEEPIFVETNLEHSETIFKKISSISDFTLYTTFTCFLSGSTDKDIIILKYLLAAFKYGTKVNKLRNKEYVIFMRNLHRQVRIELHRMKGFLRFTQLSDNILYAKMEPENNIIEFLSKHFKERLKKENWIIHDLKRNIIAAYDGNKIVYGADQNFNKELIEKLSKEDEYETMWKSYFKIIGIKERKNRRCQLNFMPKKFWKNMLEVENGV